MDTLTTSDVAERLDVSAGTVRNYSARFADHLSPGAQPGQPQRRFTESDVELLHVASQLLAQGLTYDQVNQRLTEGVANLVDAFGLEPPSEPEPSAVESADIIPAEQFRLWLSPLERALDEWQSIAESRRVELARKDAEIQRLRDELEQQRQPFWRRWFG